MVRLSSCVTTLVWGLFAGSAVAAVDAFAKLQEDARPAWESQMAKSKTCTPDKLKIRREWGDLTKDQRREYISAVLCLMELPSRLDHKKYPGVVSRYEDFVATHMNQTMSIHGTGNFLMWHRYYTWAFEQALRNECGYTGTQPYWDYGRWAQDPEHSPHFDGSDTSLSGNGAKEPVKNVGTNFPPGNGGGCLVSGPFKNMTVRLGPVAASIQPAPPPNPQRDGMGLNPRCLRRDMSNYLTSNFGTTNHIVHLTTQYKTIKTWQGALESTNVRGEVGLHGVGHFTLGGDPGGDFYTSPNDPGFWVHHSMVDRLWTVWQGLDFSQRLMAMEGGTNMFGGGPPQKLSDPVDLGVVGVPVYTLKELMSVVDGPFCYYYE